MRRGDAGVERGGHRLPLPPGDREVRRQHRGSGAVALPLRTTAPPLYTRFANIVGASLSEATVRPNARTSAPSAPPAAPARRARRASTAGPASTQAASRPSDASCARRCAALRALQGRLERCSAVWRIFLNRSERPGLVYGRAGLDCVPHMRARDRRRRARRGAVRRLRARAVRGPASTRAFCHCTSPVLVCMDNFYIKMTNDSAPSSTQAGRTARRARRAPRASTRTARG